MENQNQKESIDTLNADFTLLHRKSPSYVSEYADRAVILLSKAAKSVNVNIVFGRDSAEIKEEQLIVTENEKGLTPTKIETFRLDLASIVLPAAAAKAMAEGIIRALEAQDNQGELQQEEPKQ